MRLKTEDEMRQVRADAVKEAPIEAHFVRMAKKYDCMQRKNMPFYAPDGWPDRVIVWPCQDGITDWVELKRPKGGRYSERQLRIIAELRKRGSNVAQLHTKAKVDEYFETRANQLGVRIKKPGSKAGLKRLLELQQEA